MTVVISIQVLVAALAVVLRLDAWLRRHEPDRGDRFGVDAHGSVEFHRELIIRWDDETPHVARTTCTRAAIRRCDRRRLPLAATAHSRTFER